MLVPIAFGYLGMLPGHIIEPPKPDLTMLVMDWIHSFAGSWLALLVLAGLCFADAFFPPLPSESIVIGLSSLYFSSHGINVVPIPAIFISAVVGAMLGDSFTFWLGTHLPVERSKFFTRGKGKAVRQRTKNLLHKRGTAFIFCARFIPVGRVFVNICAGATGFGYRRFLRTTFAAVICWVGYGILIGLASGKALGPVHPLLALLVGIVGGILVSFLLDKLFSWWQRTHWEENAHPEHETKSCAGADDAPDDPQPSQE